MAFLSLLAQTLPAEPPDFSSTPAERLHSLIGFIAMIAVTIGWGALRSRRLAVPWRATLLGILLMVGCTFLVIEFPKILVWINDLIDALLGFTHEGAELVFGQLQNLSADVVDATGKKIGILNHGAYFGFFVVPTIIFFSALTAVLYHMGVMQVIVQGLAWIMAKTMKTSGAETLSAASNIFVGQTEAPLMIKPFLAAATQSELMAVMCAGFANIASGVLGLYSFWLAPFVPSAGGHLAAACFISCPASLFVAKILVPEVETPTTAGKVSFKIERIDANLVDAAARGTSEGLALALNVAAMLIAFTALVALVNAVLGWASVKVGYSAAGKPLTLQDILGAVFAPFAYAVGIPWDESKTVGSLLGIKTVLNELVAYSNMRELLLAKPEALSPRSRLLTLYALCGFANFASIGIQVGGIATMAPNRRGDLARLGLLAMAAGAISTLLAAAMVGIVK